MARSRARARMSDVFTDLVGHTQMMRRLGDEKGREVLREHERHAAAGSRGERAGEGLGDAFVLGDEPVAHASRLGRVECPERKSTRLNSSH